MSRSNYLKQFLIERGTPASSLTVRELTPAEVQRMSEYEYEWHEHENRENLEKALRPQTDKHSEADKLHWQKFIKTRSLTPEQIQTAKDAMDRLCSEYPVFVNCTANQEELSDYLISKNKLPRWDTVRDTYLELAPTGKLILNPAALGAEFEQRYGDELSGPYAMSRVRAADLRAMTTPFRSQNEQDAIRNMSADEFYKSEHGRALREERNRHADQAIREQEVRQAEAAVEFFLSANRDYARTNDNRDQILGWLKDHNLPITQNTLQQAFDELKHQLALTPDNNAEYGASRVIDMADLLPDNPMHSRPPKQHVELVEQKSVRKITLADVRKMSAEQFASALRDTDLGPQVEALLADQ